MKEKSAVGGIWLRFLLLVAGVVLLSLWSVSVWSERPEKPGPTPPPILREGMTIGEFGRENGLAGEALKKAFGLAGQAEFDRALSSLNLPAEELRARASRAQALSAEYASKNWLKIPVKFALWILFLSGVFVLMRRARITPKLRKGLYLASLALFGIILGADPGPMGTVKDAVALYAEKGVIFPPRLIAMVVFFVMVILANKFICSWGCQAGTLQDLIFRLNRDRGDTKGILRQYRLPFAWTNGFRIAFFVVFVVVAFGWGQDLFEFVDPFKIYKPAMVGTATGIFIFLMLLAGLFVYRPWCHLFCPFGLIGWLLEKISLFRIRVDYDSCIACGACEKACPSTVMGAILKRDRILPDCFACANCIAVCPTESIAFAAGRRDIPPAGKFAPAKKTA